MLQFVHRFAHGFHRLLPFRDQRGIVLLLQHQQHGLRVLVQTLQLLKPAQLPLQVAHFVENLLAGLRVIVKARPRHGVFQLLDTLLAGVDGQRLLQVLHGFAVFGQLDLQFVNRYHSYLSHPCWLVYPN